jgi:tetratricopeptide (TPR) repeat protein
MAKTQRNRSAILNKSAIFNTSATSNPTSAIVIFLIALAVRLIHVWQLRAAPYFSVLLGDARGYDEWARRLAAGDWLGSEVFYQAPLYPYFLGVIYRFVGADVLTVRVIQAIVGAGSCAALTYAGTRLFSKRVGIVAGLVLAFYPAAIFFDALVQKSVLDLFFTCVALALIGIIVGGTDRPRPVWLALGATLGALSLTRENALLLAAVLFVWAVMRKSVTAAALFLAGMAVVLLPVVARNAAVGGGFYLTTSQFGSNFFIGNNPGSDGTYMSLRQGRGDPAFERQDATELAQQALGRTLTPGEVSDYWFARATAYIRSEPLSWTRLVLRKAALLVNTSEMFDTESQESHAEHSTILAVTSPIGRFGVLVPLAIFGAIVVWSRRSQLWILYALLAAYALSVILFFVMARYRHPLLPLLVLFAAAGADGARRFWRTIPRARIAPTVAVVIVAAIVTNRPMLSSSVMRAITEHNVGTALQEQGRVDEAITHYRAALEIRPDYGPSYNNLGTALMAKGDLPAAVAAFRESLRLQPDSASARKLLADANYDLGSALLERGDVRRAEAALGESLLLNPNSAEAHNNLGIALASSGRLDEAVGHWRRALEIKPGFADAEKNLQLAGR